MLHKEVLIVKLSAIDRLSASPVKIFKIPSLKKKHNKDQLEVSSSHLKHELWNDSVED